jgi:hypothetical protein
MSHKEEDAMTGKPVVHGFLTSRAYVIHPVSIAMSREHRLTRKL